jgi:hypothetical protein
MAARNRFLKIRLSQDEYSDVLKNSDANGLTMCEYIRQQLMVVHEQLDIKAELSGLRAQVQISHQIKFDEDQSGIEALLILREMAAGRDVQILSRVRAQLAQLNVDRRVNL